MNGLRAGLGEGAGRIYDTLEKFRCMTFSQLLRCVEDDTLTPGEIIHILNTFKGMRIIEMSGERNAMVKFSSLEKWDRVLCDCIWVMMEHLEAQTEEVIRFDALCASVTNPASAPIRMAYVYNNIAYYIAALLPGEEEKTLIAAEYLRTVVSPDDKSVRVILAAFDEDSCAALPPIPDFDVMTACVRHGMIETDDPDVRFVEVRPRKIDRREGGQGAGFIG